MDIALLYAIFRRLTGLPYDNHGMPAKNDAGVLLNLEGSAGLRIPMIDSKKLAGKRGLLSAGTPSGNVRSFYQNSYRQVPIFVDGLDNREWESIYPCCSISYSDVRPGEDGAYFSQTGDRGNIATSTAGLVTVTDPDTGEVLGEAPEVLRVRPHPRPYVVEIVFTLYATNLIEMMMLERAFLAMWDGRVGLLLHQFDGKEIRSDYEFGRYIVMDQGEPYDPQKGLEGTGPAALKRGFAFTFETWLDNSVDGYNTNQHTDLETILESYLEVCNIRDSGLPYEDMTVIETHRIG